MKRLIAELVVVSLLVVGCGQGNGSKLQTDPANKSPWVAFNTSSTAPVYYLLTKKKTQDEGKLLQTIMNVANAGSPTGPASWTTDITNKRVQIREIKGVKKQVAVAVQYYKDGPYFKALAQNAKP